MIFMLWFKINSLVYGTRPKFCSCVRHKATSGESKQIFLWMTINSHNKERCPTIQLIWFVCVQSKQHNSQQQQQQQFCTEAPNWRLLFSSTTQISPMFKATNLSNCRPIQFTQIPFKYSGHWSLQWQLLWNTSRTSHSNRAQTNASSTLHLLAHFNQLTARRRRGRRPLNVHLICQKHTQNSHTLSSWFQRNNKLKSDQISATWKQ